MRSKYEMKLSKNYTKPIDGFKENGTNSNLMVIGSSGTGKTMNIVLPMLLDSFDKEPITFVVQDCKGMLYKNLVKKFIKEGYVVKLLDFTNPSKSNAFNPLIYVKTIDDARRIMIPIIKQQVHSSKDIFWETAAADLVCSLIMFIKDNYNESFLNLHFLNKYINFFARDYRNVNSTKNKNDIVDIKHDRNFISHVSEKDKKKTITVFYKKIKKLNKKRNAPNYLSDLENFFLYPDNTFNSIIAVAKGALSIFSGKELKKIVGTDDQMHLNKLANTKTIIFVNPSDTSRIYDSIVSAFYTICLENVVRSADKTKNGRLKYPFRFIIDDFASGAEIVDFDKAISNIRSRNISCTLLIQSLNQLETIYSKPMANTIVANCSTQVYLGSNDFEQEMYMSKRLNMTYDKLHKLDRKKLIIFEENRETIIDDKYNFKDHPNYSLSGLYDKKNYKEFKDVMFCRYIKGGLEA